MTFAPDALVDHLDMLLATAQARQRLPSVGACVFRDGSVVWQRALGVADARSGEAATADHAYRIGSITKTFTAVAIMQAAAVGEIELDAPLRAFLPEAPDGPTIRMALAHMTGVQRETPDVDWETMRPATREELLAGLAGAELVLPPGRQWHYSNLVFAVLGEIVARAGGSTYAEVLQARVLEPLQLGRTRLRPEGAAATPYFVEPYSDGLRVEPDPDVTELTGAAGWLWSTSGDLARWGAFLADGDPAVLERERLDEMARVRAMLDEERWTVGWGLGLELFRRGDRVFAGHEGAMPGFLASLVVQRAERTGAVVLTNSGAQVDTAALALDLAEAALDALPRVPPPWVPDGGAPPPVEPFLGRWWTEGAEVLLSYRGGRFQAELVGGPEGRSVSFLEPAGEDCWRVVEGREHGELLRALRDADGVVRKLSFASYPMTREPSTFGS
ncbi:MAG: serine hydrolase domain-containing protein [Gaiellaceae bacterium]